jgi:hypothetical protein
MDEHTENEGTEYECVVEFLADDLPPGERLAFCHGFEFCRVVELSKTGKPIEMWVFRANQTRLVKFFEDSLRGYSFRRKWADRVMLHVEDIPLEPGTEA